LYVWALDLWNSLTDSLLCVIVIQSITKAYGRVDADGSRYLLSDHAGMLHLLVITHDKERFDFYLSLTNVLKLNIALSIFLSHWPLCRNAPLTFWLKFGVVMVKHALVVFCVQNTIISNFSH
jgi:hypothetical protein